MPPQNLTQGQQFINPQTGRAEGIVNYDPNTGRRLNIGEVITPQNLAQTPPLELPPTPVSTAIPAAQGAMEAGAEQATSALDQYLIEQNKQAKEKVTAEEKSFKEKTAELLGIPQQQATLEQEADIAGKLKEQNEARAARTANNNLLIQEQRSLLKRREAIFASGSLTTGQAEAQYNEEARRSLSKQADISLNGLLLEARFENATFDLPSAQSLISHKIALITEPIKQQLEFQKFFLERNYDLLDKSEQSIMTKLVADNKAKLDKTETDLKTASDYLLKAGENGAPTPVFQSIQGAINRGRYDEARNLASPYLAKEEKLGGEYQELKTFLGRNPTQQEFLNYRRQREAAGRAPETPAGVVPAQVTTPTGQIINTQSYQNAFNNAVIGLPQASQKIATTTFSNYLKSGDLEGARNYLVRIATQGLPAADQTQALGRAQATATLNEVQDLLTQAKQLGASTNILTGSLVNAAQKLGTSTNPDLSYIGARIQQQLQVYRRSMTGVAFSPQESQEYAKIFPDITNVEKLNTAKISALLDAFDSNNRAGLSFLLGGDKNYEDIFGKKERPLLPSQIGLSDESLEREFKLLQSGEMPAITNAVPQVSGFFSNFFNQIFGQ